MNPMLRGGPNRQSTVPRPTPLATPGSPLPGPNLLVSKLRSQVIPLTRLTGKVQEKRGPALRRGYFIHVFFLVRSLLTAGPQMRF